jgi:hypothetical protein
MGAAFFAVGAERDADGPAARFVVVVVDASAALTGRGGLNAGPFRFGGLDGFGGIVI